MEGMPSMAGGTKSRDQGGSEQSIYMQGSGCMGWVYQGCWSYDASWWSDGASGHSTHLYAGLFQAK